MHIFSACLLRDLIWGRSEMKRHFVTYPWRQSDMSADLSLLAVIPETSVISSHIKQRHVDCSTSTHGHIQSLFLFSFVNVLAGACHISQSAWNHYDNMREREHPDFWVEGEDAGMKHRQRKRGMWRRLEGTTWEVKTWDMKRWDETKVRLEDITREEKIWDEMRGEETRREDYRKDKRKQD